MSKVLLNNVLIDIEDEYDILDTDYGFMAYNITIDEYLHDDYGNNTFDTYKETQDLIDKEIASSFSKI